MPKADDIRWFKQQFGGEIEAELAGTPFDLDMLVAIACQETGYIWSTLRKKSLTRAEILALCVGDTIDARPDGTGRRAFPRNKAHLVAKPNGRRMFAIARKALVDMSKYMRGYRPSARHPNKFCRGYGVFQRDLQFFLKDPDYFLNLEYEKFENTLAHCLDELKRGLRKLRFQNKQSLTDYEFACVAITYNTGRFIARRKLKQGYFDGKHFYGEKIYNFVRLSRTVGLPKPRVPGQYEVDARGGLHLRKGPGLGFAIGTTIPTGTEVTVSGFDGTDKKWARVDLQGDGLVDGHMFASFLRLIKASEQDEDD